MTSTLNALVDIYRVSPYLVGLSNGNTLMADREGSVVLIYLDFTAFYYAFN